MDELVKLVSQKTGISEEIAKQGVEMVAGFLKSNLPDALAGQVDVLLGGAVSTLKKDVKTTDDLIKLVSQKTGIPEKTAQTVVESVLGHVKGNLPEPVAGLVDSLLSGGGLPEGGAGLDDLLGGIVGQT